MIDKFITNNLENILNNTKDLISIPSIYEDSLNPTMPFGKNINTSLEYMLQLGRKLGFNTKNLDGYAGYIEFGTGDTLIGIIAHLDVVPADNTWTYPPFEGTVENGNLYGRGSIDDKGPIISSIYAMKYVMDLINKENLKSKKNNSTINIDNKVIGTTKLLTNTPDNINNKIIITNKTITTNSTFTNNLNNEKIKSKSKIDLNFEDYTVRLILGLDEESGNKSIDYYKKHEKAPDISFSPDADFPCIYAEKGVLNIQLSINYSKYFNSNILIKNIECDNNLINVVPKFASTTLLITNNSINIYKVINFLTNIINKNNFNISILQINEYELKLTSYGKQSHSAHPENGINSITRLIIIINELFIKYQCINPLFSYVSNYINIETDGKNLNLDLNDESGFLTLNLSQIYLKDDILSVNLDIRTPINTSIDTIEKEFKNRIRNIKNNFTEIKYKLLKFNEPLYIPKNNYLVTTLTDVFNNVTNSKEYFSPIAIGGATYSRSFKNSVSFGPNFPDNIDMCHKVDEFISIENLMLCTKIYATALLKLIT